MQTCDIYNFQYSGSTLSDFCDTGSNGKTKYTSFDLSKPWTIIRSRRS